MKNVRKISIVLISGILLLGFIGIHRAESAEKVIRWKMSCYFPKSFYFYKSDEYFVKLVDQMSGGRLKIQLFPIGALVGTYDLFDAVGKGAVDCASEWPTTWSGIDAGFDLLGTTPMLFTDLDYQLWLWNFGGLQIAQDLYAKYNLKWFPEYTLGGTESGYHSKKPIKSLADFKGLKIRQSGKVQGEVLHALGASPVSIAGGEVYTAMERGVIDACEYSTPANDYSMGLHEVAKWMVVPGWYQTSSIIGFIINMDKWNKLPSDLKAIVKGALSQTYIWTNSCGHYFGMEAVDKMEKAGVKITYLSSEDLEEIQKLVNQSMIKRAASHENYAKVAKSMISYLERVKTWRSMQKPFSWGTGISSIYPNIP